MEVKVIFADGYVYAKDISPISSIDEVVQDAHFAYINSKGTPSDYWEAFKDAGKNIKSVLVNGTRYNY